MHDTVTVTFTKDEREELVQSLVLHQASSPETLSRFKHLRQLLAKLARADEGPRITIGLFGGSVQWVFGNPFPIRMVEYDEDEINLTDTDERGNPCKIWFHDSDSDWAKHTWRCYP